MLNFPVDTATTAYRTFRLSVTVSGNGSWVTIGELAFYGYIDGTITANHLTVAGGVGIGTTDPKTKLHLYDTANTPCIAFQHLAADSQAGTADVLGDLCLHRSQRIITPQNQVGIRSIRRANQYDDQADIEFYVRNGGHGEQIPMVINSTGTDGDTRVGIGTTAPSQKLDVDGSIGIKGKIKFPNRPFALASRSDGDGKVTVNNFYVFTYARYNSGFYNPSNGKFTAPSGFPGYYSFTFTGLGATRETAPNTAWWVNEGAYPHAAAHVNAPFVGTSTNNRHGVSCHMCILLNEGDYVRLRVTNGAIFGDSSYYTTVVARYLFTP